MPDLGPFSISLSVRDIAASRTFYEALGFEVIDGDAEEGWLMLQNGAALIGLFRGMFEGNIITFNPPDVRALQHHLTDHDIDVALQYSQPPDQMPVEDPDTGPAHFTIEDPDGNLLLFDQF